jgi:peptidyl-prolyl cis-trans isomerase D
MAILQKIRNQGGLLVSIFVGVALLAFIVGDAFTPGSQMLSRSRNRVGSIAGESIDIQDYQVLVNNSETVFKTLRGVPSLNDEQRQQAQDNTWQMEVVRIVLQQELEKMGMGVSKEELYSRLVGDNLDPTIAQFIWSLGVDPTDREQLRVAIQNLLQFPKDHPYRATWQLLEDQTIISYQQSKYQALFAKALYVPTAQATEMVNAAGATVDFSYLMKSYNTVSDSAVTVTSAEIRDYYNSHKHLFKQQDARQLTYVSFDISPSLEDVQDTEISVAKLIPDFEAASDVMEFAKAENSTGKKVEPRFYKKGELGEELDAFLFGANNKGVYGPYVNDNAYNIIRVADRKMMSDSIRVRQIILPVDQTNFESQQRLADSLVRELRKGANFDPIARRYSADPNSAVNGGDVGWQTEDMIEQALRDTLFLAGKNEVKLVPTRGGFMILQIADKSRLMEKVLVGIVTKEINPSEKTINKVYNEVRVFADNMETADDFEKAVTERGQTKRYATVGKNDKTIAGVENGRSLIREAYMTGKTGKVLINNQRSPIFECGNKYIVALLTDIKEEGTTALQEVSSSIARELIRKKKGEVIAQELKAASVGSESLLSVAQKTNTEVLDATDISFASFMLPGAGIEPNVIAEVVRLSENNISAPIIGNQGVFVAIVTSRTEAPAISPEELEQYKLGLRSKNRELAEYQAIPSIVQAAKIEDLRYKFY